MSFVSPDVISSLDLLDQRQADTLPYGAVKIDDAGTIEVYNDYEADLAGLTTVSAIGKNWFRDIAPCTNNRLFMGRFKDGVQKGLLNTEFPYTFSYKMAITNVKVHMVRSVQGKSNWVFVKKD
ncbi:MAG: photoactive yellow protein [Candidatus Sericytochromatia bacterium]|nr:photoactive yellow protein [Candidatus Sericytochromatia bacterium]